MDALDLDHWAIISKAGDGKSTFISKMSAEYLVVDLDARWDEQNRNTLGKSHVIRKHETLEIIDEMERLSKTDHNIRTVAFDSGTAILDYVQSRGRLQSDAAAQKGTKFNLDHVHRAKADTMRVLRLAALKFHANVVWVFHLEDGMKSGAKQVRTTIPKTELERLKSNLNAILTIVTDERTGMRGIRVEWCRYNGGVAQGSVIWDVNGMWQGAPERIHEFIREYKGTEGYNGNSYSSLWLLEFLKSKQVVFSGVEEMKATLAIEVEPKWYDRNAWGAFIEKALQRSQS